MFIKKNIKVFLLIFLIVLLAGVLRFWQLGIVPPSPNWDEAALGYNAYSLLQTGKDEYGKVFPIILQSFGDYKPALYSYIAIPSVFVFGLNTFAVRLPSAILGIITVFAVYFLVNELFRRRDIALISSFLLAISPWHIQFSRVAFEANLGLALNVFGVLFFLKGLKRPWFLVLSAISFGFSLHAYQSEKVFVPLFVLSLCVIYFSALAALQKKYLALAFTVGILVSFPLVFSLVTDSNTLGRAKGVSVFNEQSVEFSNNVIELEHNKETGDIIGQVLNNRRVFYANRIVENYLSHWDINWLLRGDIARHHAPEMGLIYIWEFPFILIGIYMLLFSKFNKRTKYFIFFWFLLAPIPASITTGVPHAVRTLNFLPTWQIFTALGLISAMGLVSSIPARGWSAFGGKYKALSIKYFKFLIIIFIFLLFIFNFLYYLNQYFVQQNYFASHDWQYGYKQAVEKTTELSSEYEKIVVANDGYFDQSYIFYLFFLKYPPEKYQREVKIDIANRSFEKYEFRPIDWEKDKELKNTLFVGMPKSFPQDTDALYEISFIDKKPAIKIVGTE